MAVAEHIMSGASFLSLSCVQQNNGLNTTICADSSNCDCEYFAHYNNLFFSFLKMPNLLLEAD